MKTASRLTAALVGAALLVGGVAAPSLAAPPNPNPSPSVTPQPPIGPITDYIVPTFRLPACKGLLFTGAPRLFGANLTAVAPVGVGSRSSVIQGLVAANRGTVCGWRVNGTSNVITYSVTPISEAQRRAIIADWASRGVTGGSAGGRNLIFVTGGPSSMEAAMIMEDGLYLTATPVDGFYFPAFIQGQADHTWNLIH